MRRVLNWFTRVGALSLVLWGGTSTRAADDEPASTPELQALATQAQAFLKERCSRCHGGSNGKNAGLDVTNPATLFAPRGDAALGMAAVVPGNPKKSLLYDAVETGFMPQGGSPESKDVPADSAGLIKRWIEAGAPLPVRREIKRRTFLDDMSAIRARLLAASADDRPYLRFFTLSNLYNNESVSERDLRMYRAALSKVLNSLSWEPQPVIPEVLADTSETVLMVDIRRLGWNQRQWLAVIVQYPYTLGFEKAREEKLQAVAKDVQQFSGQDLPPFVRADWFVTTAAQPPLYHVLLDLPESLDVLERRLGVDRLGNIASSTEANRRVWRAGFAASGVSRQNRLVERHQTGQGGYYWISYDFKPRRQRGDLVRFPLGPKLPGNITTNRFAFIHDGGEVIFSLPNGQQAYLLVDGVGKRIDVGPVDVVFDRAAITGLPLVVNGVSCMNCHAKGMIDFGDEIRESRALGERVEQRVRDLYPPREEMRELVAADRERFQAGSRRITQKFLCVGEDAQQPVESFREAVGFVVERYNTDLGPREVALELGLPDVANLAARIEANRDLSRYGLGPLVETPPGTMKRDRWEAREGTSLFQDVAVELRLGYEPRSFSGR